MQTITATQSLTATDRERLRQIKKTAAFDEWRQRLRPNDRLPRGTYFKGKKAGSAFLFMDELWQANANKPYDLSQFKPFETIMFYQPSGVRVTPESLARFAVMEGVESPSPGALAVLASIEAKTDKPE
ncbi:hypothetical protein [Pseudomonas sp. DP16D-R1]|uniref:hypothetical protein n=1 Tax=Pseudomonas sp. DP16D-R1 TaxID=2075551 RepID=UPI000CD0AAB1|nr:hypothetical protein [Pseudomonas sp. DP16D-R1]POA78610.1 hypothetical protein C1890_09755 [Pseudomonas sp. DP16D-R1]